jgi:hypothetical protein
MLLGSKIQREENKKVDRWILTRPAALKSIKGTIKTDNINMENTIMILLSRENDMEAEKQVVK